MEKSVQFLALFKQSSIEQERMARFSFLFHVEDEVPEVYARDFLSCILPGRRSPHASLTAAGHAQALQREQQSQKSCNSTECPRTPGFTTTNRCVVLNVLNGLLWASYYVRGVSVLLSLTKLTWVKKLKGKPTRGQILIYSLGQICLTHSSAAVLTVDVFDHFNFRNLWRIKLFAAEKATSGGCAACSAAASPTGTPILSSGSMRQRLSVGRRWMIFLEHTPAEKREN